MEVREAYRNNSVQFSSKTHGVARSYDPTTKKLTTKNNEYCNVSVVGITAKVLTKGGAYSRLGTLVFLGFLMFSLFWFIDFPLDFRV